MKEKGLLPKLRRYARQGDDFASLVLFANALVERHAHCGTGTVSLTLRRNSAPCGTSCSWSGCKSPNRA